jgi:hypothetical protein
VKLPTPLSRGGGMREAFRSAASRREVGRVLNFFSKSANLQVQTGFAHAADPMSQCGTSLLFSYFFCFFSMFGFA